MGGMSLMGANDLLSTFVAGNVLTWVSNDKKEKKEKEP
jgi:hypothetical protein